MTETKQPPYTLWQLVKYFLYLGYAGLPEAAPLKQRLDADLQAERGNGIHLIVTQSADFATWR